MASVALTVPDDGVALVGWMPAAQLNDEVTGIGPDDGTDVHVVPPA
jgi:hypothetical protein